MKPDQEKDFTEFGESLLSVADKILDPEAIDVEQGSRVLYWLHRIELMKPLAQFCLRSEIDEQIKDTLSSDGEWNEVVRSVYFANLVQTLDTFLEETKRSEHDSTELRNLSRGLKAVADGFKSYKAKVSR